MTDWRTEWKVSDDREAQANRVEALRLAARRRGIDTGPGSTTGREPSADAMSRSLCGRCRWSTIVQRASGSVMVRCGLIGEWVVGDIEACTAFQTKGVTLTLADLEQLALRIDARPDAPGGTYL